MAHSRIGESGAVPPVSWDQRGYDNPIHPEWFRDTRERSLGKSAGITQFGVNLVELGPTSYSSLRHWHEGEDEFIYVVSGELTLIDDAGEHTLGVGSFAGFPAGDRNAHHLVNRTNEVASFLVVGSRRPGADTVHYPDEELGPISR